MSEPTVKSIPAHLSLRTKATALVLVVTVLALAVTAAANITRSNRTIAGEQRRSVTAMAQSLARAAELAVAVRDRTELTRLAEGFAWDSQVLFIAVYADDRLLAHVSRDQGAWEAYSPAGEAPPGVLVGSQPVRLGTRQNEFDPLGASVGRDAPAEAVEGAAGPPVGQVVVGLSNQPVRAAQKAQMRVTLTVAVLVAAMAGLLVLLAVHAWTRRLDALVTASEAVSAGDLERPLGDLGRDEIGRLGSAFERMRAAVQGRDRELREFNKALEAQVEQRTRALQRATERATLLAEQSQAANRAKDEFLASMSHELRTPLNAVLGLAEVLQERVHGPLNDKQAKLLGSIRESGQHLLALIEDVLDVAKIEAGKINLELGPVPLQQVCESSLALVRPSAQKKRLKVGFTYDGAVGSIEADARRLKQILVNLLSNAVKFTPEGGSIALEVGGDPQARKVALTVWDTGIGIAQDDLPRLFHPFVQLDSRLSRRYPGTGLGLALVYRLADLHGGNIAVESEVARGSRFTVSLPWRDPRAVAGEADEAQPSGEEAPVPAGEAAAGPPTDLDGPRPRILLAEDIDTNVLTVTSYLEAKGYRVEVAGNGLEALAQARDRRPALILMDIHMPVMDGLEATRRIREDPDLHHIPIVALTALAMRGDRERCLEAGADEYLAKPVSMKTLLETVEAHLAPEEGRGSG
jgi:signal transduction histidine kinase/CheY-like chemotaxis protein